MLAVLVVFSEQLLVSAGTVRGVAPGKLGMYTGAQFQCLRDHRSIPSDRVNDDVCDCIDGSDEPGTSACDNGTFYCANKGFQEKHLSSTFVDDGVCDCCDGSDEKAGCNDSCAMLGELKRKDLQAKLDLYEAGAEARAKLVPEAARRRKEWASVVNHLIPKVAELKTKVSALEEAMNEAQRKQKEAEEALKALQLPDEEEFPISDEEDPEDEHYELGDAEEEMAVEDAAVEEHPDEIGKRIAAQWTSDPDAAGDALPSQEDGSDKTYEEPAATETSSGVEQKTKSVIERLQGAASSITTALGAGSKQESASPEDQAAVEKSQALVKELTAASKVAVEAHNVESGELRGLEAQLQSAQQLSAHDYGPDHVYAALAEKCFEVLVEKYTYKVCMFVKAAQVEGRETSLGSFSECADGCSTMKYTQGQGCWQGPARSLTVHTQCGSETVILEVSEPEKCEYIATMATPAECNQSVLQEIRDEMKFLSQPNKKSVKDEL